MGISREELKEKLLEEITRLAQVKGRMRFLEEWAGLFRVKPNRIFTAIEALLREGRLKEERYKKHSRRMVIPGTGEATDWSIPLPWGEGRVAMPHLSHGARGACRFLFGGPGTWEACGEPVWERSYCEKHYRLCYKEGRHTARQRRKKRRAFVLNSQPGGRSFVNSASVEGWDD